MPGYFPFAIKSSSIIVNSFKFLVFLTFSNYQKKSTGTVMNQSLVIRLDYVMLFEKYERQHKPPIRKYLLIKYNKL